MKILISFLLSLLLFSKSNAEITKGITKVHFTEGGEVSFVLFNNVSIECGEMHGKWHSIVIYLPSKKDYFDGILKIKAGDTLYDSARHKIGYVTSSNINAMPLHNTAANTYLMRFYGFISTNDIQPSSIIENRLSELLIANKKNLTYHTFKQFITNNGFKKYSDDIDKLYPPNRSYVIWYDSYAGGPSVFRLQLIFSHDKLVAIFHGSKIKQTCFPDMQIENNNLLWFKNRNMQEMKKFADDYTRSKYSNDVDADN